MKIVKVELEKGYSWGVLNSATEVELLGSNFNFSQWGGMGPADRAKTIEACVTGKRILWDSKMALAPVPRPPKVICIGKNYADHAAEMGGESPELPIVFSKFSSSVVGPNHPVVLPKISQQVDYEAELVVVMGKPGKHIPRDEAMSHILGYTCGNDVSSRDWQKGRPGGQWLLGKSFDTFAPIGPWLTTAEEIADPHALEVQLRLNGMVMQQASTRLLLYPLDYLISHLSQFFELETGDLIFTGTPAGVGAGRNPPIFLQAGDVTEVEISGLGILSTTYIAEK